MSYGLNAPSGAQCFPTGTQPGLTSSNSCGLNAPSGAQCFPTVDVLAEALNIDVSMHLLVLSAFRLKEHAFLGTAL